MLKGSGLSKQIPWLRIFVEGVVIVGSILLAFGLQAWWEGLQDRQTEQSILGELHTALSSDFDLVQSRLDRYRRIESRTEVLLSYLRSGAPYADSLDGYFGTLYGSASVRLNTAGYESLKSQGLGLISDNGLASQIARVYEQTYPSLEGSAGTEREITRGYLRPYFLAHFRNLIFDQSATPLDYQAILGDTEFLNLVDYRLQAVKQNHIQVFTRAVSEIGALIDAISVELGG